MAIGGTTAAALPSVGTVPNAAAPQAPAGSTLADPSLVAGPPAWNDQWATAFAEAGAPPETIQQLNLSGANGADAAQLEQAYLQLKGEADAAVAQFGKEHPELLAKLEQNPEADRATIVQLATAANSGQAKPAELRMAVDAVGRSTGETTFHTMVKPMVPWMVVPGYGLLRLGFMPFNKGVDPLTGEHMLEGKLAQTFTALGAAGGSITAWNHVRNARHVANGLAIEEARTGAAITGKQRFLSYVPGTQAHRVASGAGRMDAKLAEGISHLHGAERESAQMVVDKWRTGEVAIHGDAASKFKFGMQPNTRGMVLARNKPMVTTATQHGQQVVALDGRMAGRTLAAQLAGVGVELADDTPANGNLLSRLQSISPSGSAESISALRQRVTGTASQQLLDVGYIARPQGLAKLGGALRPGPLQDSIWAADNVAAGTIGKLHGTAGISKGVKFGIPALLAVGAGALFFKHQSDKAKEAAAGAQPTAEQQAQLEQFLSLPLEQQQALLQQQATVLEQAMAQQGLTAEQQAALQAQVAEFEMFALAAEQAAGGGTAASAGAEPAPAPAA